MFHIRTSANCTNAACKDLDFRKNQIKSQKKICVPPNGRLLNDTVNCAQMAESVLPIDAYKMKKQSMFVHLYIQVVKQIRNMWKMSIHESKA